MVNYCACLGQGLEVDIGSCGPVYLLYDNQLLYIASVLEMNEHLPTRDARLFELHIIGCIHDPNNHTVAKNPSPPLNLHLLRSLLSLFNKIHNGHGYN